MKCSQKEIMYTACLKLKQVFFSYYLNKLYYINTSHVSNILKSILITFRMNIHRETLLK